MIYFKSVLAGFGALLLAICALWLGAMLMFRVVVPFVLPFVLRRFGNGTGGIGAVASAPSLLTVLVIALAIFALGFYWEFRRASGG